MKVIILVSVVASLQVIIPLINAAALDSYFEQKVPNIKEKLLKLSGVIEGNPPASEKDVLNADDTIVPVINEVSQILTELEHRSNYTMWPVFRNHIRELSRLLPLMDKNKGKFKTKDLKKNFPRLQKLHNKIIDILTAEAPSDDPKKDILTAEAPSDDPKQREVIILEKGNFALAELIRMDQENFEELTEAQFNFLTKCKGLLKKTFDHELSQNWLQAEGFNKIITSIHKKLALNEKLPLLSETRWTINKGMLVPLKLIYQSFIPSTSNAIPHKDAATTLANFLRIFKGMRARDQLEIIRLNVQLLRKLPPKLEDDKFPSDVTQNYYTFISTFNDLVERRKQLDTTTKKEENFFDELKHLSETGTIAPISKELKEIPNNLSPFSDNEHLNNALMLHMWLEQKNIEIQNYIKRIAAESIQVITTQKLDTSKCFGMEYDRDEDSVQSAFTKLIAILQYYPKAIPEEDKHVLDESVFSLMHCDWYPAYFSSYYNYRVQQESSEANNLLNEIVGDAGKKSALIELEKKLTNVIYKLFNYVKKLPSIVPQAVIGQFSDLQKLETKLSAYLIETEPDKIPTLQNITEYFKVKQEQKALKDIHERSKSAVEPLTRNELEALEYKLISVVSYLHSKSIHLKIESGKFFDPSKLHECEYLAKLENLVNNEIRRNFPDKHLSRPFFELIRDYAAEPIRFWIRHGNDKLSDKIQRLMDALNALEHLDAELQIAIVQRVFKNVNTGDMRKILNAKHISETNAESDVINGQLRQQISDILYKDLSQFVNFLTILWFTSSDKLNLITTYYKDEITLGKHSLQNYFDFVECIKHDKAAEINACRRAVPALKMYHALNRFSEHGNDFKNLKSSLDKLWKSCSGISEVINETIDPQSGETSSIPISKKRKRNVTNNEANVPVKNIDQLSIAEIINIKNIKILFNELGKNVDSRDPSKASIILNMLKETFTAPGARMSDSLMEQVKIHIASKIEYVIKLTTLSGTFTLWQSALDNIKFFEDEAIKHVQSQFDTMVGHIDAENVGEIEKGFDSFKNSCTQLNNKFVVMNMIKSNYRISLLLQELFRNTGCNSVYQLFNLLGNFYFGEPPSKWHERPTELSNANI